MNDIGLWGWVKYLFGYKQLKVYFFDEETKEKNINYWFPNYIPHKQHILGSSPFLKPKTNDDDIPDLTI